MVTEGVIAGEKYEYYADEFEDIQKQIDEEHEDDDGYKVGALRDMINKLHAEILSIPNKTVWDATASDNFKTEDRICFTKPLRAVPSSV